MKTRFQSANDAAAVLAALEHRLPHIASRAKREADLAREAGLEASRYSALVRITERAVDYAINKNLVCVDAMKQAAWDENIALDDNEEARVHNAIHMALDSITREARA